MTSSHLAILKRLRTGVVAASIGAGLGLAVLALGISIAVARADNAGDEPQPAHVNAGVQRAAQTLPPARVILPAPWEQAAPAQPVATSAKPSDHK
ncbi:hypothetical protein HU230_0036470 [Bradyrhizobium quebecense]|uniref:hypothetical protein n=1 Tax=Bradyrhizobium quebecense TaxID=2748629 RepID=UPI001CD37F01|nr:hypothetical protein [Bradyrhizobium quebecense]UGA43688.1 hypothetical protein HU230_0036470 [Bradyrhizobium quebecense]